MVRISSTLGSMRSKKGDAAGHVHAAEFRHVDMAGLGFQIVVNRQSLRLQLGMI